MNPRAVERMARQGRLYPSVILHGASAAGRQEEAVGVARLLLCDEEPAARPCGRCRHCRRIVWPGEGTVFHPDFAVLERDLRTVTSVGATKEFLRTAQVTPFEARGQVFVVASAESLSGEAANALLKTLEEPHLRAPRHFLLLAPSQFDLLPTLRSRSLSVYLGDGETLRGEDLEGPVSRFAAAVGSFRESGNGVELLGAASVLADLGGWEDPRARRPWERAAAVVLGASREPALPTDLRRRLLELAEALLDAVRMRVRAIPAKRILEGLVHRSLADL